MDRNVVGYDNAVGGRLVRFRRLSAGINGTLNGLVMLLTVAALLGGVGGALAVLFLIVRG